MEEVNKKNKGLIITIGILIVILVLSLGYIGYDRLIKKEVKQENKMEEKRENKVEQKNETEQENKIEDKQAEVKNEELDINSDLVQELYMNIKYVDIGAENIVKEVVDSDKIIYQSDLTYGLKNYLGYKKIAIGKFKREKCSEHSQAFKNNTLKYVCGNYSNYPENENGIRNYSDMSFTWTTSIDEEILKKEVEKIFGKNSYVSDEFQISHAEKYIYDESSNQYLLSTTPGGGSGAPFTLKLISARKDNDRISLIENYKVEAYNTNINIEYTFKLENGNYIFESAKKID